MLAWGANSQEAKMHIIENLVLTPSFSMMYGFILCLCIVGITRRWSR